LNNVSIPVQTIPNKKEIAESMARAIKTNRGNMTDDDLKALIKNALPGWSEAEYDEAIRRIKNIT
jgi:hypothetical protein